MEIRKLRPPLAFEVSEIATVSGYWGLERFRRSRFPGALQLATYLGCNFFDTAWAYGQGKSDGLLGRNFVSQLNRSEPC